jgi:putative membrane protein
MILFATLFSEHIMLKRDLTIAQAKSLIITDLIYGLSAIVVLVSGLLRFAYFGKGMMFYLSNPVFHTKLTLFVVVVILSIYPTIQFLSWRKSVKNGVVPEIDEKTSKRILMFIRIELTIVVLLPLLAVLMARGIGVIT